jgi:methionyl-tRNA formyltransferase
MCSQGLVVLVEDKEMVRLPRLGFLAAGTARTLSYLAAMNDARIVPAGAILVAGGRHHLEAQKALDALAIERREFASSDINAETVVTAIGKSDWEIVLFSGPPGAIIGPALLGTGRKFLHIHPGALPDYRGSTTIYYSLLERGSVAATALFLDDGIDTGPVLKEKTFAAPRDRRTIDVEFDAAIRGSVLQEVLAEIAADRLVPKTQDRVGGRTFYIIHPVLKHVAIGAGDTTD